MYNKKALSEAISKLNAAKAPKQKPDILYAKEGQWKYPGEATRIPSDTITMDNVPYPVMAYPNIGEPVLMQPGEEHYFPEADYVDEYPEMRRGGSKGLPRRKTKSLSGINKLLTKNPLLRNYGHKLFDPKHNKFQSGREVQTLYVDPNDPAGRARYQAYQDSLALTNAPYESFKITQKIDNLINQGKFEEARKLIDNKARYNIPSYKAFERLTITNNKKPEPIRGSDIGWGLNPSDPASPRYKKPTQPVEYKPNPEIVAKQQQLIDAGFDIGKADGIWGKKSQAAWEEFQTKSQEKNEEITETVATPTEDTLPEETTINENGDVYEYRIERVRGADGKYTRRKVPYAVQPGGKGKYFLLEDRKPGAKKEYQDGGNTGYVENINYNKLPISYAEALKNFVYPEVIDSSEETGYDAGLGVIKQNPNDPIANVNNPWWYEHELMHHLQNQAGAMSTYGTVGLRPNPYVASNESMAAYYNRRSSEYNNELNRILKQNPNISEEEARIRAEEDLYNNPTTTEGEARNYEEYIEAGNPSIFSKKQYQEGGTPENYNPSIAEQNTTFLNTMINSPLFLERYARMVGKPFEEAKEEGEVYRQKMAQNLQTVGIGNSTNPPVSFDSLGAAAYYFPPQSDETKTQIESLPKRGRLNEHIRQEYEKMQNLGHKLYFDKNKWTQPTDLHEKSHASTLGKLNVAKEYGYRDMSVPRSNSFWDNFEHSNYIQNYPKTSNVPAQGEDYYTQPTELKARKDVAAQKLQEFGLYDPVNENFTKEHYKKLVKLMNDPTVDSGTRKQIRDIVVPFTEEDTIRMFNDLVQNNKIPIEQYAKNGGFIEADLTEEEIEQYKKGGYIVEELPKAQSGLASQFLERAKQAQQRDPERFAEETRNLQMKKFAKDMAEANVPKTRAEADAMIESGQLKVETIAQMQAREKREAEAREQQRVAALKAYEQRVNTPGYNAWTGLPGESWRDMLAAEAAPLAAQFRVSQGDNFFDDYINPAAWVGSMAKDLGEAPKRAQQENSYLPYLTSIGMPVLGGALAGAGAKNTGQFVNNVVNPVAGVGLGKYLTTQTPLRNAYKLNPNARTAFANVDETPHWLKGFKEEWNPTTGEQFKEMKDFLDKAGDRYAELINTSRPYSKAESNLERYWIRYQDAISKGDKKLQEQLIKKMDGEIGVQNTPLNSYFNKLGSGSYGDVYSLNSNQALKKWHTPEQLSTNVDDIIEKHKQLPGDLQSRTIIPKKGAFSKTNRIEIMPRVENAKGMKPLNQATTAEMEQVLKEVDELNKSGIYVDISNPENILINPKTGKATYLDLNTSQNIISGNRYPKELKILLNQQEVPGQLPGSPNTSSVDNVIQPATPKPWQMQELPGLHLKSTMEGEAISKIVEPKTGLINTEQALAIIGKESGGADKVALIRQGLGNNIPQKMDYNDFRKTVQDQLIPLEKQFSTRKSDYGIDRLGYNYGTVEENIGGTFNVYGNPTKFKTRKEAEEFLKLNSPIENQTLILGNKNKFGRGSDAHGNPEETLGHAHFLRDAETPDVLTVTQIQSDAFQGTHRTSLKTKEQAKFNYDRQLEYYNKNKDRIERINKIQKLSKSAYENMFSGLDESLALSKADLENFTQKQLLDKNHQERYLQELVDYAGKRGDVNKMRVPTSETAAKVQGYNPIQESTLGPITKKQLDESSTFEEFFTLKKEEIKEEIGDYELNSEEINTFKKIYNDYKAGKLGKVYDPAHTTILKKYEEQPKTIKKLFGKEPTIVTDSKGNTWYEFDIPDKFKKGKGEIKAFGLAPFIGIGTAGALATSQEYQTGGAIELKLTPEEIEWYKSQGYNVEELD
jgi:hypothetical protein